MGAPTPVKPTPLRNSYWVLPGKVLAGEHPSGASRDATRERLQRLIDAGVECFIDLTEPSELKAYDRELPFSVEYLRKPIKDHSIPSQRVHMAEILDCMHDALQSGRCVYVHCRAGIGRTGTVVGCFLVERGLPGEAALDELNRLWQQCERSQSWASVPETSDQTEYVLRWKRRGIFDDQGGLSTPDLQTSDDEDDLRSGGGAAPWAHLLGNGKAKPAARQPSGASPSPRPPNAGASPAGTGAPRAVVANAARDAARQPDSEELLTDPTSVAKLSQPGKSRSGVPGWIGTKAAKIPGASSTATPAADESPGGSRATTRNSLDTTTPATLGATSATPAKGQPVEVSRDSRSSPRTTAPATAGATSATPAKGQPTDASRGGARNSAAQPPDGLSSSARVGANASAGAGPTSTRGEAATRSRAPPLPNSPASLDSRSADSGAFHAVEDDADVDPLLDPEALAAVSNLRGRFLGALVGLAVGDAVAAATQYRRPGSFAPVGDMLGGGPFDLPRGGWSDDTAMALCLADSLLERNGFDARDQMERYHRWQQQGYLSATGQCVGITASTARAIAMAQWRRQALFGSHDPSQQDPEPLSRVATAVLYYFATSGEAITQATEAARTTCQAPAVLDACRALARALHAALTGQPKAIILEKAALVAPAPSAGSSAGGGAAVATNGVAGAGGAGAVVAQRVGSTAPAALAAAIAAFGATDNFRDAILYAVNLGGDSDVVAAACGQLAGAYYSVKAIPTSWYNGLMQKELVIAYADRLLAHAMVGLGG